MNGIPLCRLPPLPPSVSHTYCSLSHTLSASAHALPPCPSYPVQHCLCLLSQAVCYLRLIPWWVSSETPGGAPPLLRTVLRQIVCQNASQLQHLQRASQPARHRGLRASTAGTVSGADLKHKPCHTITRSVSSLGEHRCSSAT